MEKERKIFAEQERKRRERRRENILHFLFFLPFLAGLAPFYGIVVKYFFIGIPPERMASDPGPNWFFATAGLLVFALSLFGMRTKKLKEIGMVIFFLVLAGITSLVFRGADSELKRLIAGWGGFLVTIGIIAFLFAVSWPWKKNSRLRGGNGEYERLINNRIQSLRRSGRRAAVFNR